MKRIIYTLIALAISITAYSQGSRDIKTMLREDPSRAGNLHHHYERLDENKTSVPDGYHAFYISHYGRHGSRYLGSAHEIEPVIEGFKAMDEAGLLTKKGKALYADFQTLYDAHDGMYGMLSQRGGNEHRGIAKRMYGRAEEVFCQADRDSVTCVSTPVHRCIQSMANFTLSLKEEAPALKVAYYSGERYRSYLNRDTDDSESIKEAKDLEERMLKEEFDTRRLVRVYFKDLIKDRVGKHRPEKFFYYLFKAGAISQCLDGDIPDCLACFNEDELYTLWRINNIRSYAGMCNSVESKGARNSRGALILRDIVEKADLALAEDSRVAADLRFAHDSGISPLISLLALEGNENGISIMEANEHWFCFENVCMGTNLQIIFYKNEDGNVLVKFLHNERERAIPALTAVSGHCYSWTDVRAYCQKLIDEYLPR